MPLQNTTQQPDLTFLTNRATRKAIFENSWNRTERGDANDTRATIARLAQLRARERPRCWAIPNFAAWNLTDQMAKTPEAAIHFLDALVPAATARAGREAKDIQALIDAQHGGFTLEPWDWEFYAEQVRKAKYDLDESQVKPYFELNNVLENGVFYAAHELYGLTFKERKDIPVYQPDVRVFEVFDADGKPLALWYCDYFKRDNKNGGAWMDSLVGQSKLLGTAAGGLQRGQLREARAGAARAAQLRRRDHDVPRVRPRAARHVRQHRCIPACRARRCRATSSSFPRSSTSTGPAIRRCLRTTRSTTRPASRCPRSWRRRSRSRKTFNQGYDLTEILGGRRSSTCEWHTLPGERAAPESRHVRDRRRSRGRIWRELLCRRATAPATSCTSGPTATQAGYYAYLWTEMLDDDAFQWFRGSRRPDARQRRPLPADGAFARQHRGPGEDVRGVAGRRSRASSRC